MLKGIVVGNIVSTRKQEALVGSKFLEVEIIENGEKTGKYIALFSVCNFGMLALLLGIESLWLAFMG